MINDDNDKNKPNGEETPGAGSADERTQALGDDLDDAFDDDFGDDFGDEDPGFADFDDESRKNTISAVIQDNPLAKVGVVLGAAALLIGIVIYMGISPKRPDQSYVPTGSDITQAPGTAEVSQAIKEAYEEVNEEEVIRAEREGDSAMPIQIDPPSVALSIPEEDEPEEDPLQRWRRLQEERLQKELERTEIVDPAPPVQQGPDPAIGALAQAMSQQMQSILERQGQNNFGYKLVADQTYIEELFSGSGGGAGGGGSGGDGDGGEGGGGDDVVFEEVLLPAGELLYGQLLTEANSDTPGPVLAMIASGPLKGSRLIGGFDVQDDLLSLIFDTLVYEGRTIPVDAIALNPDTTIPGLATEVDNRYLKRVFFPAAAAFIEGAASAISNSGLTTITIDGETVAEETNETDSDQEIASGLEEAAKEVGEILDDIGQETEVLVRIAPGTPLGLLFLQEVVDIQDDAL